MGTGMAAVLFSLYSLNFGTQSLGSSVLAVRRILVSTKVVTGERHLQQTLSDERFTASNQIIYKIVI